MTATLALDERTELEELAALYSDMHKDAFGFRDRSDISHWTIVDFQEEFESLGRIIDQDNRDTAAAEAAAVIEVEKTIAKLISIGAGNRETAIRWLADGENVNGDMEYLCFSLHLPYGYFS